MIALSLAGIALISMLAQWLAWFLQVPAILFLLLSWTGLEWVIRRKAGLL